MHKRTALFALAGALSLSPLPLGAQSDSRARDTAQAASEWATDLARARTTLATIPSALYAVGLDVALGGSALYRIDNYGSAPQAHLVGMTAEDLTDLAIDPTTGRCYATSFDGDLYEIDSNSGVASAVGFTGRFDLNALEFDASGQAWAWSTNGRFYRINKEVGVATLIGNVGFDSGGDLAFDINGTLFGTTRDQLVRINVSTGVGTLVGSLGFSGAFGLEIATDGTMYAGRGADSIGLAELYRVNKNSGAGTFVGTVAGAGQFGLGGLSFAPPSSGPCVAGPTVLCLNNGRFRVEASYQSAASGGFGQAFRLTDDTGYFWFFSANNVEVIVKILNACGVNNRYWAFAAGLTNQGVVITITDTQNATVSKTYSNPLNRTFVTITDTNALPSCP